ncbi:MFS transporter [Flavobacterium sp. MK4S-17]|uniref:MFS transporter n=1 Tax=Flavobacterium sp. MK4S-17 TaxID=2543737 RepID=UPI001359EB2A|nr:MFS transporter [Flavobacterium sp. MK4S-17]
MELKQACCADYQICCPTNATPQSLSPTIVASVAMALGGMADAFLYAYLPVNAKVLGLSVIAVGVILSINKFVRFFFNRWVNALAKPLGLKAILFLASVLSSISALAYAFPMPLWLWIIVRIAWGSAYSMFRFSSVQFAQLAPNKSHAIGLTTALRELGPVVAYWIGPMILSLWGVRILFITAALLPLLCFPFLRALPPLKPEIHTPSTTRFQKANWLDTWVFISSFLIDGLIVVGVSISFEIKGNPDPENLLLNTAVFISLRKVFQIVLAPAAGNIIGKFGFRRVFIWSSVTICASLMLLLGNIIIPSLIILFISAAFNNVCLPLFALEEATTESNYNTFTKLASSKDLGGAVGALVGLQLMQSVQHQLLFSILLLLAAITLFKIFKFVK